MIDCQTSSLTAGLPPAPQPRLVARLAPLIGYLQALSAAAESEPCLCRHALKGHGHYRAGNDCAQCTVDAPCPRYRPITAVRLALRVRRDRRRA